MNLGIDLLFLIPTDFWDYISYAIFFVALTAIPAILNLRYNNEISIIQFLLSVIGFTGTIYSLFKAWFAAPSDGSLYYLVLTGFSTALVILVSLNLVIKSKIKGLYSTECFVSLFGLIVFAIVAVISVFKAWFVIPSNDFMDYLRFACIWGICALICAGSLAALKFMHNNFKEDLQILGVLGSLFLMEMIYSLLKTWGTVPNSLKFEILAGVVGIVCMTGGAFSAGAYRHQSE